MIFLTLGTQKFNFIRLLKAVERAINKGVIKDKVIAQIGNNAFQSDKMECMTFIDKKSFNQYMNDARFIISHAGTGSIVSALKNNKKIIVAARLAKYNEHIDNHQLEILNLFARKNLIIPLNLELEDLEEKISNIHTYNLSEFKSNAINFNTSLTHLIKGI